MKFQIKWLKKIKDFFQYVAAYFKPKQPDYKIVHIEHTTKKPITIHSEFVLNRDVVREYRGAEHQLIHFTNNKLAIELTEQLKKGGFIECEQYNDPYTGDIKVRARLTVVK